MKNPQRFLLKFMVFSKSDFANFFLKWNLILLIVGSRRVKQTLAAHTPQDIYITGVSKALFYLQESLSKLVSRDTNSWRYTDLASYAEALICPRAELKCCGTGPGSVWNTFPEWYTPSVPASCRTSGRSQNGLLSCISQLEFWCFFPPIFHSKKAARFPEAALNSQLEMLENPSSLFRQLVWASVYMKSPILNSTAICCW